MTTTRSLYTLPTGEVATMQTMADHTGDPASVGWVVVFWGSLEDYDADTAQDGDPWSDRATCSVVVDTEDEARAEVGAA